MTCAPRCASSSEQARPIPLPAPVTTASIVIDTPPLVPVPDCRVIERAVDGFVVVVAARRTPRRLVEEAVGLVAPGKLVGLVFNGSDHPRLDYEPVRRANGGASRRRWSVKAPRARRARVG